MPNQLYQRIYLSPHLDDAALSCGGRIYQERQAGLSVLVLNIFAGDPPPAATETAFVAALHARWELDTNPVQARRAEDQRALALLDAAGLYWELPDCIYRRHPATGQFLYYTEKHLNGPVHPSEEGLVETVAQRLAALPLAAGGHVYAPLTVGGHVDHRLVRQAAEAWGAPGGELVYYEDYPYAARPGTLAAILGDGNWRDELLYLAEREMAAKIAAIACYDSQISTFFCGVDEMAQRLRAYAASVGGAVGVGAERYWRQG